MAAETSKRLRLTDAIVRRLPVPATGNRITYDGGADAVAGFGCRVTAGGARSFILNYRTRAGRERRLTIGGADRWRVTEARAEARRLKREIDQGRDPLADLEDERSAPTVAELIDRFTEEHLPRKRPSTASEYAQILRNHVRQFGAMKVADVGFADVDALHRRITKTGSSYTANRTISVVHVLFALAERWGWRPAGERNPASGIERNPETKRRRYLGGEELARLLAALAVERDQKSAAIVRLLLLTGSRRGETLQMRWSDVDLTRGVWSKPASTTKSGIDHAVPLSGPARALLAELAAAARPGDTYVFPGTDGGGPMHKVALERCWSRLRRAADIADVRLHDLRHSFASQLASAGLSLPVIGALLGHSQPSTTARYSHLFDDPLRRATEAVGAIITAAERPPDQEEPHEVVPLKR